MPYKLIGYAVWRAGKWYLRRRYPGTRRKLALAALGSALAAGGLAAAQRGQGSSDAS